MTKEKQSFRIWAVHEGRRTLMHSIDDPHGRARALQAVELLKQQPDIQVIEMRQHLVSRVEGDEAPPRARRGTLRWERAADGWRQVGG